MKKYLIGTAILGGVGLFGYSIYRYITIQADLLKNFTYEIASLGIETIDTQLIKGTLVVVFRNNSNIDITVKEFYLDFFLNGVRVGYIQDIEPFTINAKGESQIPFEYTLNPQLILGDITDIIGYFTREKDALFTIKGIASLKSGFIKVALPIDYSITMNEILSS